VFVDDGSTDETSQIANQYPVQLVTGSGQGPGAARNLGWRTAKSELIWFIDSDCVAEQDALRWLIFRMMQHDIQGVGGSYSNLFPECLLARLIHEEIVARHEQMQAEVDFLGGFNVLYRRSALESAQGFDELEVNGPGRPGAEDCDLSFRISRRGDRLGFERRSVVGHHHPRSLWRYLRSQFIHGLWRVRLYVRHQGKLGGDSYSGILDHMQPMFALIVFFSGVLAWCEPFQWVFAISCIATFGCGVPMYWRLRKRVVAGALGFLPLSAVRSLTRAFGLISGSLSCLVRPPARVTINPVSSMVPPALKATQSLEVPSS
jgi:cellulose synthase/poly-beta-1,6-N-acetylglucosamine synthase-like glycosyltransferase